MPTRLISMRAVMVTLVVCVCAVAGVWAQSEPPTLDALVSDGRDAMYRLEYADAREAFGRAIQQYPESPVGYGLMAVATFNELLYRAANPVLQEYGAPNPYSSSRIYKSIEAESRRFHQATDRLIAFTDSILDVEPENVEAMYFRGLAEENLAAEAIVIRRSKGGAISHGRRAKGIHEDLLELDPEFVDAQVSVAGYEFALATLPGVIKALLTPACLVGWFCGDKDKAFELMDEVARRGHYRNVDAQVLLSVMHAEHGDPERAVEILRSLGEEYPESYLVELNMAAILELKLEEPREALGTYQGLLDSLPEKTPGLAPGEVHFLIGRTRYRLEEYEEAEASLQRALDAPTTEQETEPLVYFYLGRTLEELDREEDSLASYREFVMRAGSMESLEDEVRAANRKLR
jgi:tetratricopeptide (TPR) repeat protein